MKEAARLAEQFESLEVITPMPDNNNRMMISSSHLKSKLDDDGKKEDICDEEEEKSAPRDPKKDLRNLEVHSFEPFIPESEASQ